MSQLQRLGLGTVQWGTRYGVTNRDGQTSSLEVARILAAAKGLGIRLLDTAHAYGQAEAILGAHSVASKGFQIVTKTAPIDESCARADAVAFVSSTFLESLQRLKCSRIFGLLVHRSEDLLGNRGAQLWDTLERAKADAKVQKIGVSVYQPRDLEMILDRFPIDIVQLPVNIYDQRFIQAGLLQRLKEADIEVHARSVFLQGLLFLPSQSLPDYFAALRVHQQRLHSQLKEADLSLLTAALWFAFSDTCIDRVIVGCENVAQLDAIQKEAQREAPGLPPLGQFAIDNEALIVPSRWKT